MAEEEKAKFVLPASVAEPAEVMRAARELDAVDDFLREAAIRNTLNASSVPKTSRGLTELAESNGLNLLQEGDRAKLVRLLEAIQKAAPVLHVSFAAEPSAQFVNKLITNLRQSIHPYVLVQIGLQPSIAGGCIVRSENKLFDFSLRQYLQKHKDLLTKAIAKVDAQADAQEAKPAPTDTPAQAQASAPQADAAPVPSASQPMSAQAATPAEAQAATPQPAAPSPQPIPAPPTAKLAEPLTPVGGAHEEAKA